MPRNDRTFERIQSFADRRDWTVKKAASCYALLDEGGRPIARLKLRPDGDFEV